MTKSLSGEECRYLYGFFLCVWSVTQIGNILFPYNMEKTSDCHSEFPVWNEHGVIGNYPSSSNYLVSYNVHRIVLFHFSFSPVQWEKLKVHNDSSIIQLSNISLITFYISSFFERGCRSECCFIHEHYHISILRCVSLQCSINYTDAIHWKYALKLITMSS